MPKRGFHGPLSDHISDESRSRKEGTLIYSIQTILSIPSILSNRDKNSLHSPVFLILHDVLRGVTRENVKSRENRVYRVIPLPPIRSSIPGGVQAWRCKAGCKACARCPWRTFIDIEFVLYFPQEFL